MNNRKYPILSFLILILLFPHLAHAAGAEDVMGLHKVLDQLYKDMLPLCSKLITVGSGIAGFAALWSISSKVWQHLANAEPINFYPLFRPFVIGTCVFMFSSVINLLNGVLQPVVNGTAEMVASSDQAITVLLKQKEEALKKTTVWQMYVGETGSGDRDKWYQYTHPGENADDEGWMDAIGNDIKFAMERAGYNIRNSIKEWMSEILQFLFAGVSLCINTIRTFNLLILAILGPIVFGLSVFDGFHHTLKYWLAKYVNVFMWLPVANIYGAVIGKIQENMLKIDLSQIDNTGGTFFSSTDVGYMIFLLIGIVGYTTVPSVANYIMFVGGQDMMAFKTTRLASTAVSTAASGAIGGMGAIYSTAGKIANGAESGLRNLTGLGSGTKGGSANGSVSNAHQRSKLDGNAS